MKRLASAAIAASLLALPATAAEWKPDHPINLIVPWSAGGSTDQVTRVVAPILAEALGQSVVVVNQPGASGSVGTQAVLDAPRDGYTWTANAVSDVGNYAVTGLIAGTSLADYKPYLHIANVPVISVTADSPYQDLGQLLDALKKGDDVTVATAGVNSSGGMALTAFQNAAAVEARMIAYDGGNPAVLAAASGEAVATTQLASEQVEMIKAGKIRPLAALSSQPLEVEGIDQIPPITKWLPDMPTAPAYFGVFIPTGAPQEVYDTVDQIWNDKVATSDALKTYALQHGAIFDPAVGDAAVSKAMPVITMQACARAKAGEAAVDPGTIGVTCPM